MCQFQLVNSKLELAIDSSQKYRSARKPREFGHSRRGISEYRSWNSHISRVPTHSRGASSPGTHSDPLHNVLLPKFDKCVFTHTKQITEKCVWEYLQHLARRKEKE